MATPAQINIENNDEKALQDSIDNLSAKELLELLQLKEQTTVEIYNLMHTKQSLANEVAQLQQQLEQAKAAYNSQVQTLSTTPYNNNNNNTSLI